MRKLLNFCLIAAAAALLAAPAGCGGGPETGSTLRLGHLNQDLHQLAFFVAEKKGFFREEGLDVKVSGVYASGPEEMAAFQAGALDAGYVGMAPAMVAVANGRAEVKALAQANLNGSALVVHNPPSIFGMEDLPGRRVAVPNPGTMQDFLLRRALAEAGLSIGDLQVVYMAPPEMLSALSSDSLDACLVWEPFVARMEAEGVGSVMLDSRLIWEDHPCCILAVSSQFLRDRPEDARALLRAHRKATAFINEHPDEALQLAVEFTGLSEEVAAAAMRRITFTDSLDEKATMEYARFLGEQGLAPIDDPLRFASDFLFEP